jgi:hypothetical protein
MALTPEEVVRLVDLKSLVVRGDAAIVAETAAAPLHPDAVPESESDEEPPDEAPEGADEEEEASEPAVARGATLRLVRRLEPGAFFFKPGSARKSSGSYYTPPRWWIIWCDTRSARSWPVAPPRRSSACA